MPLCKACRYIFLGRRNPHPKWARLCDGLDWAWMDEGYPETEDELEPGKESEPEPENRSEDDGDLSNEFQAENDSEVSAAQAQVTPGAKRSRRKDSYNELISDEESSPTSGVCCSRRKKRKGNEDNDRGDFLHSIPHTHSLVPPQSPLLNVQGCFASDDGMNTSNESLALEESEDEVGLKHESQASDEPFVVNNPHEDEEIPRFIYHESCREFREAANGGCQLCLMFRAQFSEADRLALDQQPQEIDPSLDPDDYAITYSITGEVGFGVGNRLTSASWSLLGHFIFPDHGEENLHAVTYEVRFATAKKQIPLSTFRASESVGSDGTAIPLVQDWIETCNKTHKLCSHRSLSFTQNSTSDAGGPQPSRSLDSNMPNPESQSEPTMFPFARIIDVGSISGVEEPRLCEARDVPAHALYMTLSHRWGDFQPLTLTVDNYEAMKICIPPKNLPDRDLPKSFADAISFTRKLGVRFLWIDSLCIIQEGDESKDWANQSAVMGAIYMGSHCNIAATAALDGQGGLHFPRNPDSVLPLRVFLPHPARVARILNRPCDQYYDVMDIEMWTREVTESTLCRRAWVVQERALARRTLHFGKTQLYWECSEISACETWVGGLEYFLSTASDILSFKRHDPLRPDLPNTLSSFERGRAQPLPPFFSVWGRLVADYTASGLTHDTDKLVAISSLAKIMAERAEIRYLAGMWDYKLPTQLLWLTQKPEPRPKYYRAPSWSWASINSPIIPRIQALDDPVISIIPVEITPPKTPSFYQVESVRLRIRGGLIPGMLRPQGKVRGSVMDYSLSVRQSIDNERFQVSIWLDATENNCGPVFCVPIELRSWGGLAHKGLILEAKDTKGEFQRIGIFALYYPTRYSRATCRTMLLMDPRTPPPISEPRSEFDDQIFYSHIDRGDVSVGSDDDDCRYLESFLFDVL